MADTDHPPRTRWEPRAARATAWVAVILLLIPTGIAAGMIADDLTTSGEKFDGLEAAVGGVLLGAVAVVIAPLAWFLRRGGRVAFLTGMVMSGCLLVWIASMGFA